MKTKSNKALMCSGIITAIAASLCCITPVLALVAGTSGIASSFSWMDPFRPYLIGITVLVLGFAWYQKLKPRTAEEIACACEEDEKPPLMQTKKFLGIVTVFAIIMMAFPYYSPMFYPDHNKEVIIVNASDIETIHLNIEGMTCPACDSHVKNAAYNVGGVIEADASSETGTADVKFDKSKTTAAEIIESINKTSYKVIDYKIEN